MQGGCKLPTICLLFRAKQGLNCIDQSLLPLQPPPPLLTNEFGRFVGPFIDEGLKGLLHGIDEPLIPREAALRHVVHLVLEVQQVLHHVFVFFWGAHYLSSKRLRRESGVDVRGTEQCFPHVFVASEGWCVPLCNPSRTAAAWGDLP